MNYIQIVFRFTQPTSIEIQQRVAEADGLSLECLRLLSVNQGVIRDIPQGFQHDNSRSYLGNGPATFAEAKLAFEQWGMFDLGWVRVANPDTPLAEGKIVAVQARTLGLWTLNLSRIVETIETATQYGFLYSTTKLHVERGEERFLLEIDAEGEVWYAIEAVSRPRQILALFGFPVTRFFQHRFARDSHARMFRAVANSRNEGNREASE